MKAAVATLQSAARFPPIGDKAAGPRATPRAPHHRAAHVSAAGASSPQRGASVFLQDEVRACRNRIDDALRMDLYHGAYKVSRKHGRHWQGGPVFSSMHCYQSCLMQQHAGLALLLKRVLSCRTATRRRSRPSLTRGVRVMTSTTGAMIVPSHGHLVLLCGRVVISSLR